MKIDVESRDFFKDPFTETELKKIIKMTGKNHKNYFERETKHTKK